MSDLPRYTSWGAVPENLETKTQLGAMELKSAKGQGRAALKVNTFLHEERYDLHSLAQAASTRPVTARCKGQGSPRGGKR